MAGPATENVMNHVVDERLTCCVTPERPPDERTHGGRYGYEISSHDRRHAAAGPAHPFRGASMTRNRIMKKDGTPSAFFWSDEDGHEPTRKTLYHLTSDGVKRIRGVYFDVHAQKVHRE
jgi:hypothetical protein